ncbi:hypothetical protein [Desulfotomaculum copahuensis]|uniref:Peptidase S7 domain-containing protein n=1 Tax=Desulfotomaculum copahuensis TaxID=1838280 RepID=A0A1B7LFV5_9FIRM|nr:hypothetical protein [Desulfotomaculum copahuensis]OAT83580.1 hypothetical protein A6M21_07785 [Desulfotomaculum copahuensis]
MDGLRTMALNHRWSLMQLPNVIGVGIGYKEVGGKKTNQLSLHVLVKHKTTLRFLAAAQRVPDKVGEYQTDVIEVGSVRLQASRVGKMRPAVPGVSIGHFNVTAGTFGALVYDQRTGRPMILSNNHILANQTDGMDGRCKIGDDILQPGAHDKGRAPGDVIARLARFVPVYSSGSANQCPVAAAAEVMLNNFLSAYRPNYYVKLYNRRRTTNLVDCALAEPVDEKQVAPEIMGIGRVTGVAEPRLGARVRKSGRTSGITTGTVKSLHTTMRVDLDNDSWAMFEDQILATGMSEPGDSGSLVVDEQNRAVGLLFAGSDQATLFNNINNVTKALNVRFDSE